MLKAVEKKKAYEDIVKQIRDLIEKGRLKKGDQLPTERELTETFKVSRATVREAIRTLESMMLVESRQGNGTYVLASSEEALVQPLAAALFHEKDDLMDIFYIRKLIEPSIAQLAAGNATRDEIKELEEILGKQEQDIENGVSSLETDSAFHTILARMAKNRALGRLLLALVDLLEETREEYLQNGVRARESLQGHQKILAAIRSGDCAAARQAMIRHLEGVEGLLFKKKRGGGKCE
ncbi:MAG TPA: FadR/GntR family transcriptional regulator [Thermodesulfovibrionales bacterium]|nr:FadR/GntR family transcriptional regulator [Thermodesulfovibrionales bacterium]